MATEIWNANVGASTLSMSPTIAWELKDGRVCLIGYSDRQFYTDPRNEFCEERFLAELREDPWWIPIFPDAAAFWQWREELEQASEEACRR